MIKNCPPLESALDLHRLYQYLCMPVSYTHLDVYKRQRYKFEVEDNVTDEKGEIHVVGHHRKVGLISDTCLLYTSRCV